MLSIYIYVVAEVKSETRNHAVCETVICSLLDFISFSALFNENLYNIDRDVVV